MKLESSLKHFSPQGMNISDDVKSTSPNRLTGTDVMAARDTTRRRIQDCGCLIPSNSLNRCWMMA